MGGQEVSGEEAALYLLIAISFTLCLVPEFAGGERESGEKRLLCFGTNRAIQSKRRRRAARAILLGLGRPLATGRAHPTDPRSVVWTCAGHPKWIKYSGFFAGPKATYWRVPQTGEFRQSTFWQNASRLLPAVSQYRSSGSPSLEINDLLPEYTEGVRSS